LIGSKSNNHVERLRITIHKPRELNPESGHEQLRQNAMREKNIYIISV